MHTLISGRSGSGKSTLAFHLSRIARRRSRVMVFDPFTASGWDADEIYDDIDNLKSRLEETDGAVVFLDEAGQYLNRYDADHHWFATVSRHYGHRVHFIAQRWSQFPPIIRTNCSANYVLNQRREDIDQIMIDYDCEIDPIIPQFQGYWLRNFKPPIKFSVHPDRLTIVGQ